ncbi:M56 family metallopeptidase [Colwelliaceae bacterium 6471]
MNMLDNLTSNPFLYSLALTLIHFLWQGLLVALTLKSALICISYKKPQLRYALSSLAMLLNLLLPFITFFIIYKPDYLQLITPTQHAVLADSGITLSQSGENVWYNDILGFLPYISMLWLTSVSMLACKLLIEVYSVNQLSKSAAVPNNEGLSLRFQELVNRIQLTRTPQLLISLKTDVPMAIGWLKPVVLLPATMITGLTPAQLDMLILHELAHIRRHDYLVNFIQTLVEILLFFHPAVLWVSNQMRNEREYCSDDIAVSASGDPIAYAHTLADTAALCRKHRHHSIPSMAMAASGGDLKQRVVRLVDQHHCSAKNNVGKWLASATIVVSIALLISKQLSTIAIIDFTTGDIGIKSEGRNALQKVFIPHHVNHLPETSIAQQLLTPKIEKTVPSLQKKSTPSDVSSFESTDQEASVIAQVEAKTPAVKHVIKAENIDNNPAQTQKTNVKANDENAFENQEKSIADLAFERTDSKQENSRINNKYAIEIAELANEVPSDSTQEASFKTPTKKILYNFSVSSEQSRPSSNREFKVSQNKSDAKLISSVDPKYPATAKRRGLELDVTVHFTIDREGKVRNIQFDSQSKVSYFRSTIRNAIEQWHFLPAQANGEPVESQMTKIFSFNLMN